MQSPLSLRVFATLTLASTLSLAAVPADADSDTFTVAIAPARTAPGSHATAPIPLDYHAGAMLASDDACAGVVLASLNAHRAERGLAPLTIEPRLVQIASGFARAMLERRFFGHYTPEGQGTFQRFQLADYRYSYAGENLAFDRSAAAAAQDLWESPEHRANIVEPHYTKIGVAAVPTALGVLVVEDFSD